MSHKENLEFLQFSYRGSKPLTGFEALCDWYFSSQEREIKVCAHRAYRDFCRRLTGIGACDTQVKKDWRKDAEKMIAREIQAMLDHPVDTQEKFDAWHHAVCTELMTMTAKKRKVLKLRNDFSYGLAQKWVNMTLKNMMIMEKWDTPLKAVMAYLHVPVDRYIIETAWRMPDVILPLNCSPEGKAKYRKSGYRDDKCIAWSKWEYPDYKSFQQSLRKALEREERSPIQWEGSEWLKIAQKKASK